MYTHTKPSENKFFFLSVFRTTKYDNRPLEYKHHRTRDAQGEEVTYSFWLDLFSYGNPGYVRLSNRNWAEPVIAVGRKSPRKDPY